MRHATAQKLRPLIGNAVGADDRLDRIGRRGDQRNYGWGVKQIGSDEVAYMKDVALKLLGIVQQQAKHVGLRRNLDIHGVLDGLDRDQRVADRAYPAYPADDGLNVVEMPPADHRLEESRSLGHLPLTIQHLAVGNVDDDIAVTLDTRHVINVNLYILACLYRITHNVCPCLLENKTILLFN